MSAKSKYVNKRHLFSVLVLSLAIVMGLIAYYVFYVYEHDFSVVLFKVDGRYGSSPDIEIHNSNGDISIVKNEGLVDEQMLLLSQSEQDELRGMINKAYKVRPFGKRQFREGPPSGPLRVLHIDRKSYVFDTLADNASIDERITDLVDFLLELQEY